MSILLKLILNSWNQVKLFMNQKIIWRQKRIIKIIITKVDIVQWIQQPPAREIIKRTTPWNINHNKMVVALISQMSTMNSRNRLNKIASIPMLINCWFTMKRLNHLKVNMQVVIWAIFKTMRIKNKSKKILKRNELHRKNSHGKKYNCNYYENNRKQIFDNTLQDSHPLNNNNNCNFNTHHKCKFKCLIRK